MSPREDGVEKSQYKIRNNIPVSGIKCVRCIICDATECQYRNYLDLAVGSYRTFSVGTRVSIRWWLRQLNTFQTTRNCQVIFAVNSPEKKTFCSQVVLHKKSLQSVLANKVHFPRFLNTDCLNLLSRISKSVNFVLFDILYDFFLAPTNFRRPLSHTLKNQ